MKIEIPIQFTNTNETKIQFCLNFQGATDTNQDNLAKQVCSSQYLSNIEMVMPCTVSEKYTFKRKYKYKMYKYK